MKRPQSISPTAVRQARSKLLRTLASCRYTLPATTAESPAGIDVVDLFCGCGGFSSGFRIASKFTRAYRIAGALDINADAMETYRRNLGVAPCGLDAHDVATTKSDWTEFTRSLKRENGNATVVIGGPPCQGFTSHKRTINGQEQLNQLFPDFARIATRLDADAIVMENVAELLTERSWPFYQEAADILRAAGYVVRTRVHNLAGYGVPQERFRSVTVAMRHPFAMPEPFLQRDDYRTVREAISFLPPIKPGVANPGDPDHVTAGHKSSTVNTIAAVPKDGGRRPMHVGPECLRRLAVRNGRSGYDDVYGRLWWDRPSVTITGSSRNPASGRFSHPEQDRGLSVREAAQLQGFPLDFAFSGTLDSRFLQVGNAVPPSYAAYLATHLLSQLAAGGKGDLGDQSKDITSPVGTSFSRMISGIKTGAIAI